MASSTDPVPPQKGPEAEHKTDSLVAAGAATTNSDVEKQVSENAPCCEASQSRLSAFSALGFLDRFLAVWIFLAMLVGILLGNFVDDVGPALQKGTFVDVSVPIGLFPRFQCKARRSCC